MKSFIIAAVSSSSGKTTVSLGLMEALRRRGLSVQPYKAGPDYIDPAHHRALLGRPSYNLDTWMMGVDGVRRTFLSHAGADAGIVEGVMGLFDGRDGRCEEGSTAHLAKALGLPVLLVINAEKTGRSVAAVVKGFRAFDPDVDLRWVLFNRVGGESHFRLLKDSIRGLGVKCAGYIPRDEGLKNPERHLGLVSPFDTQGRWKGFVKAAGDAVEKHVDLGLLMRGARGVRRSSFSPRVEEGERVRLAVAYDRAFWFYYEENLEIMKEAGAEIRFFSPLNDRRLPEGTQGIYLGGGYPELYAPELKANAHMRKAIREASEVSTPVFAECGGLMYLGRSIADCDGKRFEMAGVFPWVTGMRQKRAALGYREVSFKKGNPFGAHRARGHEFRYSEIDGGAGDVKRFFKVRSRTGGFEEGYLVKNTLATYVHLHFASSPAFAGSFVNRCRDVR